MEDIPIQDRLPPRVIDIRAKATPDRVFAYLPKGQALQDGFYPLSYAVLARAVDAAAWWMDETLGRVDGNNFPTIPYIGLNDFRYPLLIYASIKTHRKIMLPLAHNTPEAQVRLLNIESCNVVLAASQMTHRWDPARAAIANLRVVEVPELSYFFDKTEVSPYAYTRTADEGMHDPAFTIQTSGTTGNPKPLNYSNRAALITYQEGGEDLAVVALLHKAYFTNLLPLSWGLGLTAATTWPLITNTMVILLPANMPQPITPQYVIESLKWVPRGDINGTIFVPAVLRALARNPLHLEALRQYDWIGYGGAPLDYPTGDLIAKYTRVQSVNGATDVGGYPLLLNDPSDWKIHRFHPTSLRYHFEHFQDDLYELCTSRMPLDPRPCFAMDPTLEVYHTKDLWRKAPGREDEGFWMTAGRIDDFVKLASMTKFNAIQIEQLLDRHPLIESSLVAGDGRAQPFAIVQLKADETSDISESEQIEKIWSAFENANTYIDKDAHLTKQLTIIADSKMPLRKTAKGTVDRRNTIKMYESKIEEVYGKVGQP